MKSTKKE